MNKTFKDLEIRQRHINASNGADCVGKLRKIHNGASNWDLYYCPELEHCECIAKPDSGCGNAVYGNLSYVKFQLRRGELDPHRLTKYGRRILKNI